MTAARGMSRRAALAALSSAAASAAVPASAAQPSPAIAQPPQAIAVAASRITRFSRLSSEHTFGRLTFRGGLALTSATSGFGGFSGLAVDRDGERCLTVTDEGHWLAAHLTYDGDAPSGLADVRFGRLQSQSGRDLDRKREADAEALALVEGTLTRGTVLIAFERAHRIGRFPIVGGLLQPQVGTLKLPPEARQMRANKGFEAVAILRGGPYANAVVALSERFPSPDGTHVGWIWLDGEPRRFGLTDIDGFEITDAASLPEGRLLILERRFRWTEGVKMRLRLLEPDELVPGKVAAGVVLLSADLTSEIDNIEGLSVHTDRAGRTVVTLLSDDNFNAVLQRTILLQFTLAL